MKQTIKRAFINAGKILVLTAWATASVYQMSINMLCLPAVVVSLFIIRFFMFDS